MFSIWHRVRTLLGVAFLLQAGCATYAPVSSGAPTVLDRADLKALEQMLMLLPGDEKYYNLNTMVGGTLISLGGNKVFGVQHSFPLYIFPGDLEINGRIL